MKQLIPVVLCAAVLASVPVEAQDAASDEWQFHIAPLYLWAVSQDGTMAVRGVESDFTLDFDDAFDNLEMVFTVHFEARKGRWAMLADVSYLELSGSQPLPVGQQSANVDLVNLILEGAGGYQFADAWWAIVGVRYFSLDPEITFPVRPAIDENESWTDVFAGVMWRPSLGERWTFSGRFDIGAGDSDLVWNATALFDFKANSWLALFFGYRHMDYDYKDDSNGFAYDVSMTGPVAGLRFYW